MVSRAAALLWPLLASCSLVTDSFVTNDFSGDPFPFHVDTRSGAVLVGFQPDGFEARVAVLDVMSPFTVIDPGVSADGTPVPASISTSSVTLLGRRETSPPEVIYDVPRARLLDKNVVTLHPCEVQSCAVGTPAAPQEFRAIVGSEALAGDALRLRLGEDTVFLLPDIGGTELDRTYECDAVFPEPYRGGGTLIVAGTEIEFSGRRVTLQACLGANPDFETAPPLAQGARGTDILAVLSTGIGISILGTAAYERYRLVVPGAPALATLTDEELFLPSGPITGRRVTIDSLALVAKSGSSPRAPCRQVYAHHLLSTRDCRAADDCPCTASTFCSVPAVVETGTPIEVLVVPDSNRTLIALRTELRPDQPDVDAILGTSALQQLELDIDYPHNRVLMRCAGADCRTRPALAETSARPRTKLCIDAQDPS